MSFADRILAALRGEKRLVLVTGDLPPNGPQLCEALRKVSASLHRVIAIRCDPLLTRHALSRAGFVSTTLVAGDGTVTVTEGSEPGSALLVFDDAD